MHYKEIAEIVRDVAGEDVLPLVKYLRNKSNVSEFKLAEILEQEINLVRNMLYRLYNHNLVSFTRKKDKKKGWYIYYWTFNENKLDFLAQAVRRAKLAKLKERLAREQENQFFMCPDRCLRLEFGSAMDYEFKCPECGELLGIEDNSRTIEYLKGQIAQLEESLKGKKPAKKKKKTAAKKKKTTKKKKKAAKKKKAVKKKKVKRKKKAAKKKKTVKRKKK